MRFSRSAAFSAASTSVRDRFPDLIHHFQRLALNTTLLQCCMQRRHRQISLDSHAPLPSLQAFRIKISQDLKIDTAFVVH